MDQIHTHMRPLLMMLGDYRSLTLNVVNRLTSVTRLFPNSFNDKFCDQMMVRVTGGTDTQGWLGFLSDVERWR